VTAATGECKNYRDMFGD